MKAKTVRFNDVASSRPQTNIPSIPIPLPASSKRERIWYVHPGFGYVPKDIVAVIDTLIKEARDQVVEVANIADHAPDITNRLLENLIGSNLSRSVMDEWTSGVRPEFVFGVPCSPYELEMLQSAFCSPSRIGPTKMVTKDLALPMLICENMLHPHKKPHDAALRYAGLVAYDCIDMYHTLDPHPKARYIVFIIIATDTVWDVYAAIKSTKHRQTGELFVEVYQVASFNLTSDQLLLSLFVKQLSNWIELQHAPIIKSIKKCFNKQFGSPEIGSSSSMSPRNTSVDSGSTSGSSMKD